MKVWTLAIILMGYAGLAMAQNKIVIPINAVDDNGIGAPAGQVIVTESKYGLIFKPVLSNLPIGLHGFHIHENPSCAPADKDGKKTAAMAAGGHLDPHKAGRHGAPWGDGHLGDLPALFVDDEGNAIQPLLAPRLKLADIKGRSLMIHAGGDNHADQPAAQGGGGARIFCGVIP